MVVCYSGWNERKHNTGVILLHEHQDLIVNRERTLKPKLIVFG